ncbi:zinc finger CCCH domain-containing protein 18-like [Aristolochia californica]|uniref:zinc finger CCCH domain-containing protein 18-like n=1 Tax=Aristolochia californica TaxID=171875 RepID=UPI0035DB946C
MGEESEERAFEQQLELQLEEQRESLTAVKEALLLDPANSELLSVHEELLVVIKDGEEGLLHLKRSRLLRETDSMLLGQCVESPSEDHQEEPLDPKQFQPESLEDKGCLESPSEDHQVEPLDPNQVQPEPLEDQGFSVGSKCRFRHTDGRWYNGHIIGLNSDVSVRISFLTPTSVSMMICKFFLQQRCRFGSNCRLSHGVDVSLSSLRPYVPTVWQQSLVGSNLLAISDRHAGIWREAELESWDDKLSMGQVVFQDDGSSVRLGIDSLSLSEYALVSEEEEDETDSEDSESSYEENPENGVAHQGLGFLEATTSQRGVQTETTVFTDWEHHTRGIASKMMANMGYRQGMGLGISGQGMVDPVPVKVLPPKQSLDHAVKSLKTKEDTVGTWGRKRSRGGKRKREKKFAAVVRAAKAMEEKHPDVFNFINNQLGKQTKAQQRSGKIQKEGFEGSRHEKKQDRRALVAYDDEVKDLRHQVEKLEEMVSRNRKDKAVYEAFSRKLEETRKDLADAEAAHTSASNAVVSKEKEKRWLKF